MKLFNDVVIIGDPQLHNNGHYKGYTGTLRIITSDYYFVLLEANGKLCKFPKNRVILRYQ